jgi:hypothetical protein
MLSPRTLAEIQDALDAISPPVETRNGVLTVDDISRLREATEREVTKRDPTPPTDSQPDVEQERPIMRPETTGQQRRREV